jgi:hypothetical protein
VVNIKTKEQVLRHDQDNDGLNRRGFLDCMAWFVEGTTALAIVDSTLD